MAKGFDRIAPIYDGLARLVYGSAIRRAQLFYLPQLSRGGEVLILGGGTGWFLAELLKAVEPTQVTYVDTSARMLQKSRARIEKEVPALLGRVEFVHGDRRAVPPERRYDLICTHFYLDMFEGRALAEEVAALKARLRPNGRWLFADFRFPKRWPMSRIARILVWLMYRFFRLCCGIPAGRLENYEAALVDAGMDKLAKSDHYGRMIRGLALRKPAPRP